jgi:hypothetical protein
MSEAAGDLDGISGSFDLDGLKKKYRCRGAAAKPRHALAAIEREILQEVASQSGRYGAQLDTLLAAMRTLRQRIEHDTAQRPPNDLNGSGAGETLDASIAQYNRLRAQAQRVQHYLIIHREAMGFWNHDDVFRCYPIPAPMPPHVSLPLPRPSESSSAERTPAAR